MATTKEAAAYFVAGELKASTYGFWGGSWMFKLPPAEQDRFAARHATLPLAIELETPAGLVAIIHADLPAPTWALPGTARAVIGR